jgi:hypothetical protein
MPKPIGTRRDFLKSSSSVVGASLLALNTPLILAACQTAQTNLVSKAGYVNISTEDALELAAVVDQMAARKIDHPDFLLPDSLLIGTCLPNPAGLVEENLSCRPSNRQAQHL